MSPMVYLDSGAVFVDMDYLYNLNIERYLCICYNAIRDKRQNIITKGN